MPLTLDVSKLRGWLNADAPCRVDRGRTMRGARCGPGGGRATLGRRRRKRHARGRPDFQGVRVRARAGRTTNMRNMFVTPEVSQLEMSALKFFNISKRNPMSVMAETHQSAIGPYFAMADAAFELNSPTAVLRTPLLPKV